jgi:hypothetical protein
VRMAPVPPRVVILLAAIGTGALFVAGLFVPGPLGGVLLALTDVILVGLTTWAWASLRPETRPLRLVVIVAVGVLAVLKLTGVIGG